MSMLSTLASLESPEFTEDIWAAGEGEAINTHFDWDRVSVCV
jgi:hypothetical protein